MKIGWIFKGQWAGTRCVLVTASKEGTPWLGMRGVCGGLALLLGIALWFHRHEGEG